MSLRRYPIGIQSFEYLRSKGFLYVDKTKFIHELVNLGSKAYFLSRPRRFGKSLFLSTLKAFFEGKKMLFEGLVIEQLEKEWCEHPVFYIDLNRERYAVSDELEIILDTHLAEWEKLYGKEEKEKTAASRFAGLIKRAFEQTGKEVVVLIDEYDKPLLQNIGNEPMLSEMKAILKSFYGVFESADQHLRFIMLTGVTKFGQVSVFSDLNHLNDISMDCRYGEVCGITEEELYENFKPELHRIAEYNQMTYEETCLEMRRRYNGYHFSEDATGVYNPFGLLLAFDKLKFQNYWFSTGTPTFLVELLKESNYDLRNLEGVELTPDMFGDYRADADQPIPVIYQSGYLTIKSYNKEFNTYTLGFPNDEVKYSFLECLLPSFTQIHLNAPFNIKQFVLELRAGDIEGFMDRLKTIYADFPYELTVKNEHYYNGVLYLIFRLLGQYVNSQIQSNKGRADAIVQTDKYIYIFELKLEGTAQQALAQIEEKGYAAPFAKDPRQLFKIGVVFDAESCNVGEYLVETND